jgi:3-oxoacyl-(acyl-carrier-protein) synthase
MTDSTRITAASIADANGLRGSTGIRTKWSDVDQDPAAGQVKFKPIFGTRFPEFRRLDILSRMFVVATEACGLPALLDDETRIDTALVLATATGCLAADQRFERSLQIPKGIEPAVFPYTLPNTCLGEVAIRHRLRGPTLCLSVAPGEEGLALTTAQGLLLDREARAALVLLGDWVPGEKTRVAVLLLSPGDPDTSSLAALDAVLSSPFEGIEEILETTAS